ncbi:hypothetical protein FDP41_002675 [Naegleria fowleri]|uniref:Uncharacterized protein n=1 Tax=Naegleria fowleri TaxID=5763 RepID=A0A6A5BWZ0_NAEFO|nr:uncharacterized protein FDP41_002675 [Naegleria fowleri]KAF0978160.1 hypothetical protein FDP41_002675 [Naegleria fowleri]CAG4712192.1 unnamed protein product [Naegleria fowleri]
MQQQAFYPMQTTQHLMESSFNYQQQGFPQQQSSYQQPRKYIVPEQQTPFQADPNALHSILNNQQFHSEQSFIDPYNLNARYSYVPGGSSHPKTPGKSPYSNHQMMMIHSNLNKENDYQFNTNTNGCLNTSTHAFQRQSILQPKTPGKSSSNTSLISSTAITPGRSSLRKESLCKTGEKKFLHTPKRATAVSNQSKPKTPSHHKTSLLNTSSTSFNNNNSTNGGMSSLNNSIMLSNNNSSRNVNGRTNSSQSSKRNVSSVVKENDRKSQRFTHSQTNRQAQSSTHSKQKQSAQYSKGANTSCNDGIHGFLTSTASSSSLIFDNCDTSSDDTFMNTTLNSSLNDCAEQDIYRFLDAQLQKRSRNDLKDILERYIQLRLSYSHRDAGADETLFSRSLSSNTSIYEMESEETTCQEVDSVSTLTQPSVSTAPTFNVFNTSASNGSCNSSSQTLGGSQQVSNLANSNHSSSRTSIYSHSGLNSSLVRYEPSDLIKRLLREEEQRCQMISQVVTNPHQQHYLR